MVSFGIINDNKHSIKTTIQLAQIAEKYNFDYFFNAEENPSAPYRDVWVAQYATLQNTSRIKVATVSCPYTRHPALLAVTVNTLNEVFPNRAHLVLTPGGYLVLHPLNIPTWNRPIRALRETFEIILGLLDGQTLDYQGELFKTTKVKLDPFPRKPWENWLTARGPQMIKLAGRFAQGTILSAPYDFIEYAVQKLQEGATLSGRSIKDILIGNMLPTVVSDDPDKTEDILRQYLCFTIPNTPDISHEKCGIPLEHVHRVQHVLTTEGLQAASAVITPKMLDTYALKGDVDSIIKQVRGQITRGIQHICFCSPLHPEDPMKGLEILGREVVPQFK